MCSISEVQQTIPSPTSYWYPKPDIRPTSRSPWTAQTRLMPPLPSQTYPLSATESPPLPVHSTATNSEWSWQSMMSGTAKLPTSLSDYSRKSMSNTKNTKIISVFFVFLIDYKIHTKQHFHENTFPQIHKTTFPQTHKTILQQVNKTTFPQVHKTTLQQIHKTTFSYIHKTTLSQIHEITFP